MQNLIQRFGIYLLSAMVGSLAIPGAHASGPDSELSLSLSSVAGTTTLAQGTTATTTAAGSDKSIDHYRVDTGDGVSVTVYGEPDLSVKDERVKGNGTISYPLLGAVQVRGMTATEIQDLITKKLADGYLKKPNVLVDIDTYRMFFIKGEVRNPGGYSYQDGLTVEKAVALAGGFTERASKSAITVYRDGDAKDTAREVNPTTPIRPGDVVTIGESFF